MTGGAGRVNSDTNAGADTGQNTGQNMGPSRVTQAVFLERQSYRRRRLVDVARLLPLLGVLLLLVPLLWPDSNDAAVISGLTPAMPMSDAITYIFAVWCALIVGSVLFGAAARRWGERPSEPGRD